MAAASGDPGAESPGPAGPAEDTADDELVGTAQQTIREVLDALRGGEPDAEVRRFFRERAARCAAEGVPLATLLRAHAIGSRAILDALREAAQPHEQPALADSLALLLRAGEQINGDIVRAYEDESARHDRDRALVRDLLAGILPADGSWPTGLFRPDDGVVVLALDLAGPAGADAHRRLRIQHALDRRFGRGVPMLLEIDGGHALVPHPLLPSPQGPALDAIAALVTAISPDARIAAAAAARPGEVARAARTASEVLRLAGRLGRPGGAHRLSDVLLEYHLTRRDASTAQLEGLLAPLDQRPELLETVRVYLEEHYDRRRAAQRLSLHPNTVDNRLARTTELTGLDPSTPRGVALLVAALALRDLG